ncbi:hypothetical protein HFX_1710 [Haloferax mediterranei ATCC 33500]|uniref:Uncharacterized protein n=1 Tax=Haloferax mediterranei (strain ATCC 33500 / DSM 1411 / JCM 8866 / NBRC 14739 / NCIMB 2177 / R-4) TaxID=523841 RepID=I3R5A6_HALMT|nr:hypothetical protein HFX_1710 [Haloferax mediterranei ATCC 33500]
MLIEQQVIRDSRLNYTDYSNDLLPESVASLRSKQSEPRLLVTTTIVAFATGYTPGRTTAVDRVYNDLQTLL